MNGTKARPQSALPQNNPADPAQHDTPGNCPGHDTEIMADTLADDLLRGAEAIAGFLFGNKNHRRKVYHLAETSRLPVFRLGAVLCARRSVLMHWIVEQEKRGIRGLTPEQ